MTKQGEQPWRLSDTCAWAVRRVATCAMLIGLVCMLAALGAGDVLALAGKGHESGQTIAGVTTPFDDAAVVRALVGAMA